MQWHITINLLIHIPLGFVLASIQPMWIWVWLKSVGISRTQSKRLWWKQVPNHLYRLQFSTLAHTIVHTCHSVVNHYTAFKQADVHKWRECNLNLMR